MRDRWIASRQLRGNPGRFVRHPCLRQAAGLPKRGGASVSSTVPSAAISATRPSFCQSANGWRSLISMRSRSGYNLRTVASAIHGLVIRRVRARAASRNRSDERSVMPASVRISPRSTSCSPVERDLGNAEAELVGGRVAQILQVLDDLRDVAAPDRAVAGTARSRMAAAEEPAPRGIFRLTSKPPQRRASAANVIRRSATITRTMDVVSVVSD